ncbi:hypothetical protein LTR72_011685 [Exophiala xenobiotica]|nr:hypothetical protein LTR72_011685 [Exophiala xenobiotica]
MYGLVVCWLRARPLMKNIRTLQVKRYGVYYDRNEGHGDHDGRDAHTQSDATIFNFHTWDATQPPRYYPYDNSGLFLYKGCYFRIDRQRLQSPNGSTRELLKITVFWPSAKPLRCLIEDARQFGLSNYPTRTWIYPPMVNLAKSADCGCNLAVIRPSRSMAAVVLDHKQKEAIVTDMNKFLRPGMATWYAERGIPHRRGYLLSGPPGTGKSSMSFALAGVFGLSIYCLSLTEASLTEEALLSLFNQLPERCVVLLEDVDSAGISRVKESPMPKHPESYVQMKDSRNMLKRERQEEPLEQPGNGISLSALLNAIDGVAAPEDRVLIMTTNYPERLDDALVRPGRVDMKIEFNRASKQQIREIFLGMYYGPYAKPGDSESEKSVLQQRTLSNEATLVPSAAGQHGFSGPEISAMGDKFASALPDFRHTPAEIQGFLLIRKDDPRKAVKEVAVLGELLARQESKAPEERQSTAGVLPENASI